MQGYETTLRVTVDDMIYHAKAVKRAVKDALVVVQAALVGIQDEFGAAQHILAELTPLELSPSSNPQS